MGGKVESPWNRLDLFTLNESVITETIELLQLMIKTDTTNPPGNEVVLAKILEKIAKNEKCPYLNTKIIETQPARGNLIITIEGTKPTEYSTWGFHGHLDVVRADGDWKYPPFSGELVQLEHDKFIWGRGTLDMKKQCTAHLMALLLLIRDGWRPKGDIKLIYTADEESGGRKGAELLVKNHYEEVKVDCMIDELGGEKLPTGSDFFIQRGEKGKLQLDLTFVGRAGHGSTPIHLETYALYKLVKVLDKIRKRKQTVYITSEYKETIKALTIPKIVKFFLKRKLLLKPVLTLASKIFKIEIDKLIFALVTNTIAPTIVKAGEKVNVISPKANLSLDIRILPRHTEQTILTSLKQKFGSTLFDEITFNLIDVMEPTISPICTSFYKKIDTIMKTMYTNANLVPVLGVGGTDSKFWRKKGIPCYGFTPTIVDKDNDIMSLIHAPNERVSVNNLMIATEFAYRLMKEL
jgi:acetylornithine deacetylase/succinyl-diaminopimelate desuccinylase-like protein